MTNCHQFTYLTSLSRLWVLARAAASVLSHCPLFDQVEARRRALRSVMLRSMRTMAQRMRGELAHQPDLAASLLGTVARLHDHCTGYSPERCPERSDLVGYFTCIGSQASMLFALARSRDQQVADAAHAMAEACEQTVELLQEGQAFLTFAARSA